MSRAALYMHLVDKPASRCNSAVRWYEYVANAQARGTDKEMTRILRVTASLRKVCWADEHGSVCRFIQAMGLGKTKQSDRHSKTTHSHCHA